MTIIVLSFIIPISQGQGGKPTERVAEMTNLPNLQGSEKQIKWASDIRESFVSKVGEYQVLIEQYEKIWKAVESKGGWKNAAPEERQSKRDLSIPRQKIQGIIEMLAFAEIKKSDKGKTHQPMYKHFNELEADMKAAGINEWQREINLGVYKAEKAKTYLESETSASAYISLSQKR